MSKKTLSQPPRPNHHRSPHCSTTIYHHLATSIKQPFFSHSLISHHYPPSDHSCTNLTAANLHPSNYHALLHHYQPIVNNTHLQHQPEHRQNATITTLLNHHHRHQPLLRCIRERSQPSRQPPPSTCMHICVFLHNEHNPTQFVPLRRVDIDMSMSTLS